MGFKFFWFIRGLFYALFFKKYSLPSYIGKPVFISNFKKIIIGRKVRIYPGLRVETVGKKAEVVFENNVSCGQNLHIVSSNKIVIGKNTTISANVFISDTDHDYKKIDFHILKQQLLVKKTSIGENCFLGYGVVLQPGTVLGKQCVVGSNAVVKGVFKDYSVIVGIPARVIKRYNTDTKKWEKTNKDGTFIR